MSPSYDHVNKQILSRIDRLDITDYVRIFLSELSKLERQPVRINTDFDALRVKGLLSTPSKTRFKSLTDLKTGFHYWDEQEVDYVPSNLSRTGGFLFYFICNGCRKRVKYLYEYDTLSSPLCRSCCRIRYKRKRV